MKEIAYLGAGLSGRGTNLRALAELAGGQLSADGPILSLVTKSAHGPITARTVPGRVFEDAPRDRVFASADAIVFVTDGRAERLDATIEAWENLMARNEARRLPVVIQHNQRDVGELGVDEIEAALGVQPILVSGALRMPNPIAMLYPHRIAAVAARGEGVRETFDAAARAAYFGFPQPDPAKADFAMKMLDRQISGALEQAAPGVDPKLARDAVKDDAARDRYLAAAKDAFMQSLFDRLENDPAFQEEIAKAVVARAESSVLFEAVCPACKHAHPNVEIGFQAKDAKGPFRVGDPLPVDLAAIDPAAYVRVRPYDGGQLLFLDGLECDECHALVWLGFVVEQGKLAGVWPVVLNRTTLERCHWVTAGVALEAARLAGRDPDTLTPAGTLEILRARLPA